MALPKSFVPDSAKKKALPTSFVADAPSIPRDELKRKIAEDQVKYDAEAKQASSPWGFAMNAIKAPSTGYIPGIGGASRVANVVDRSITGSSDAQIGADESKVYADSVVQLRKQIREAKAAGRDASRLEKLAGEFERKLGGAVESTKTAADSIPKNSEAYGALAQTALDVGTLGTYGAATKGMKSFSRTRVTPNTVAVAKNVLNEPARLFSKKTAGQALEGAGIGYGYDVALGAQGDRGEARTGAGAFIPGAGTALGGIIPAIPAAVRTIREPSIGRKSVDDLVGMIVQGKTKDIPRAKSALLNIDTSGVKTYSDLKGAVTRHIDDIQQGLDQVLSTNTSVKLLDDLASVKKVGDETIKHNYVKDALDHLDELYAKTNDPANAARIRQLRAKAEAQGLMVKEVNDLAKIHGTEFGAKAFSKMGDPLTSVNAQAFENTRTGLKTTARDIFNDPVYNAADKEVSDLLRVKTLVSNMEEAVNKLNQRIKGRGIGEKLGRVLSWVVDTATGGLAKGAVQYFLPRGQGLKVLNALDLEKNLGSYLRQFQELSRKASSLPADDVMRLLDDFIVNNQRNLDATVPSAAITKPIAKSAMPARNTPQNTANRIGAIKDVKASGDIVDTSISKIVPRKSDAYGAIAGFEVDNDGNITFDPTKAALGIVGVAGITRAQGLTNIAKKLDDASIGELQDFSTVIRNGGVKTNNKGELVFKDLARMTKEEVEEAYKAGLRFINLAGKSMQKIDGKSNSSIASFFDDIIKEYEKKFALPQKKSLPVSVKNDSLIQEARKYKSAEEFVDKQPTYYHTTKSENVSSIESKGFSGEIGELSKASGGNMQKGVFLYPEKSSATSFGKNFKNPSVVETKIQGKVYDANKQTKYGWEDDLQTQEIAKNKAIIDQLRKDGFVGVKSTELGTDAIFVFEPTAVKTKSQLIDFYNNAVKNNAKIGSKTIPVRGAGGKFNGSKKP